MSRVFCLGNGESRLDYDITKLKSKGKIYGCNAIYRDYPDLLTGLIAVDHGIMHEIYHSGYAKTSDCYFRDWTKLPGQMFKSIIYGVTEKANEFDEVIKKFDVTKSNEREEGMEEFVMHGVNLAGVVTILKQQRKVKTTKKIDSKQLYWSWIYPNDKSHNISDLMPNDRDMGWAAGATSGYIAVKKEQPKELYMIGHDLVSPTGKVNNIYKDTKNYIVAQANATNPTNWITQWNTLFEQNPNVKFIKVNKGKDTEYLPNNEIKEWVKWKEDRLEYITFEELDKRLEL